MVSHQAAFLARTPESPEVQAFATTLVSQSLGDTEFNLVDGISCAEAEVIAIVFNADLRLARLRAGVTRATAENAGLWEDPMIGIDLTRIVERTPDPWKLFTSVGITIPISGRLEIEKQRAGVEHAAELARVAQSEWSVRMAVRRAWSEWTALDARLATTRDFITRIEQVTSIVDKMEQSGEIGRTEARLFRIEKLTKAGELALLESRVREADLRLRQLMGMSPEAPLNLRAGGIGPARAEPINISFGETGRASLEHRSPPVLVAKAEYEAAERTLELEVRKQYPDLHIAPGYGREDGQDQILLGVSVPIPILNANRKGIAEATARREYARARAETTFEQILSGLRAAEVRFQAATQRRQRLETELVPLVDAQYADVRQVARLGEVNILVLLESLTRQQEAKVSLIDARRDEALAGVDLDELLGPTPAGSVSQLVSSTTNESGVSATTTATTGDAGR
jgi:outer membrane protein, heavy metal efflux system